MNERPNIREGFVEAKPEPPAPKPLPPPELAPSPIEQDEIVIEPDKWPLVVRLLYKPLQVTPGDTRKELSFREPTGADIHRYGNPVRVGQDGDLLIEERKMHFMMSALAGVEPPIMGLLDTRDWTSCAFALRRFFAPDPRAWLSVTTTL